jgi:primary-amine oxidase
MSTTLPHRRFRALALTVLIGSLPTPATAHDSGSSAGTDTAIRLAPGDPLSADEIALTSRVVRADPRFPDGAWFASIDLVEPPKDVAGGDAPARRARATVLDLAGSRTLEVDVALGDQAVAHWREVSGQPPVLLEEYGIVTEVVRADPRWQEAMRRRGISDFSQVMVDGWAAGPLPGTRQLRGVSYLQGDQVNYYGRPVEGVVAVVDMSTRRVLEVLDRGVVPLAEASQDLTPEALGPSRPALPPLYVVQPEGVGYQRSGHAVSWDRWRFRLGFSSREGLVLRQVRFVEGDRERSVLHRGALSEMAVPYGDPTSGTWSWRAAFDVGEYGMGRLATALGRGVDVPHNAELLPSVTADAQGTPLLMPDRIAIYERDGGVAWRHYDWNTGDNVGRRSRELVVAFAAAIGNYDYLFHWVFQQDGTLKMEVVLSGILLAKGTTATAIETIGCPGCTGHLVAPRVEAPNHQHFFSFRLDLDVDGRANSLLETNAQAVPMGPANPEGNAFAKVETPLESELLARRSVDASRARMWRVVNPAGRNALGNTSGYMLMPSGNAVPYLAAENSTRRRAAFVEHHLWATRHREDELWAAGDYPNQAAADHGLSRYVADDESLTGEDLVLWYTLGVTHFPREEEWPIMNAHHAGFTLSPAGFFSRNPALDLPLR